MKVHRDDLNELWVLSIPDIYTISIIQYIPATYNIGRNISI